MDKSSLKMVLKSLLKKYCTTLVDEELVDLRFGQWFHNEYLSKDLITSKGTLLYYEQDLGVCIKTIEEWLVDNSYDKSEPTPVRSV